MFKGLGNLATLMNQARNIGGQMEGVSEELKAKQVVGEAGGSMVKVHANGIGQILRIEVDPVLAEKNDLEMVVDLLPAAINDAIAKSKQLHLEAMQSMTGGLELPAGLEDSLKSMLGATGASGDDDSNNEEQS